MIYPYTMIPKDNNILDMIKSGDITLIVAPSRKDRGTTYRRYLFLYKNGGGFYAKTSVSRDRIIKHLSIRKML
jgi:hypothetical protein